EDRPRLGRSDAITPLSGSGWSTHPAQAAPRRRLGHLLAGALSRVDVGESSGGRPLGEESWDGRRGAGLPREPGSRRTLPTSSRAPPYLPPAARNSHRSTVRRCTRSTARRPSWASE